MTEVRIDSVVRGRDAGASPGHAAVTADRGVTAANPVLGLTSDMLLTSNGSRGNADRGDAVGNGRVHDLKQMAEAIVADAVPC
jgi:hypothetical protein